MTEANGVIQVSRSLDGLAMYRLRQLWRQPQVDDIERAVQEALRASGATARIRPGDEIAITAGSRGIATMPAVLRATVDAVRRCGGEPFIFPAMGSHGGGTADGQRALLADLGVDEHTMGAPIRASMDVVQIGQTDAGVPVCLDAIASRAAGIIVVNRVKKHTNFDAAIESGLCKMTVIGMGKHRQAVEVHQYGNSGLRDHIPPVARVVLARANVLAGLALIENARGGLAEIVGLAAGEIQEREPALLQRAKDLSPKIPFSRVDIAVVEWLGKEISGTGMDCYVIGRRRIIGEPDWPEAPQISSLAVLDLTAASHGNALGVGLADFTTRRLVDKIDWPLLRANIMTSGNLERGKIPLEAAAFRERSVPLDALRMVALRDTLHLEHLLVSATLAEEARRRDDLEVLEGPMPLPLDGAGNWVSPLSR
jgi:hypothetical protein